MKIIRSLKELYLLSAEERKKIKNIKRESYLKEREALAVEEGQLSATGERR